MMTSTPTRIVCAILSTISTAGLVAFADPAHVVGTGSAKGKPALIIAAGPGASSTRG